MNIIGKLELELLHTPETSILGKIKNVIFGAALYISWATFVLFLYKTFVPEFSGVNLQFMYFPKSDMYIFISSCILAPFIEEIFFRKPLNLLKKFEQEKAILWYILFSSTLFGYLHNGSWSIPIQGVAGLIFCYVYLKNGYSYFSSVACHFLVNFYYFLTTN